ncbi:hypothetical protein BKH46_05010 [Helicobacter sp. 12S02634-8]|uniref:class I SAM-dependent DNA methyltransferase n=1 Tax=Helicobacter sp. 12S02634-8 TaxID=1476199 RepID=UPI000BA7012E|nr:class I SAM-dependent methyltransferase [Helicobacter sp. 12S02634-8]PAF47081.1 hypothetical protein BKH46_05010 [Helicobacter sp. 12S02634-8]
MQAHLKNSFSKSAHTYQAHALIQAQVAQKLLEALEIKSLGDVMDMGCGSGHIAILMQKMGIKVERFWGVDISQKMLELHPRVLDGMGEICLICEDFERFCFQQYDLMIGASSLQWARDIESLLARVAKSCKRAAFGIYTNKSLQQLHDFLGTDSPLWSQEHLREILERYFDGRIWIERMEQEFLRREDFLVHLKNSGLLGGGVLSYKQAKYFATQVPFTKASYEILMFIGTPKKL